MAEHEWSGATEEKKFWSTADVFIKSSLREDDWQRHYTTGKKYRPKMGLERAKNEAVNLKFIQTHTDIPVPKVICEYEDNGAYIIVMSRAKGVPMDTLTTSDKAVVTAKMKLVMNTLHGLRSSRIGGASGLVCPPHPVLNKIPHEECEWFLARADSDIYVFCHMDAHMKNIYVDPVTLEITSLIDFEFSGFYPQRFDLPLYQYEASQLPDRSDFAEQLLKFFALCQVTQNSRIPTKGRTSSSSRTIPKTRSEDQLIAHGKACDGRVPKRLQRRSSH